MKVPDRPLFRVSTPTSRNCLASVSSIAVNSSTYWWFSASVW